MAISLLIKDVPLRYDPRRARRNFYRNLRLGSLTLYRVDVVR